MKVLNRLQADVVYYDNEILQEAFQGATGLSGLNAETLQQAIDILFQLVLPLIPNLIGGAPTTENNQYFILLDGGTPSSGEPEQIIDGGSASLT